MPRECGPREAETSTIELITGRFLHVLAKPSEVCDLLTEATRNAYMRPPHSTNAMRLPPDPIPATPNLVPFQSAKNRYGFDAVWVQPLHVVGVYPLDLASEREP